MAAELIFFKMKMDNVLKLIRSPAGLDYPAIGPEHSYLRELKRADYTYATDEQVKEAFKEVSRMEGIIPALETAHALSYAIKAAKNYSNEDVILVNFSGRGDKDVERMDV